MKTLTEVAATLERKRVEQQVTFEDLAEAAGLSRLGTRNVLRGEAAPKVTTLMALADKLGLEVMLLPKPLAATLSPATTGERPLSRVEQLKYGTDAEYAPRVAGGAMGAKPAKEVGLRSQGPAIGAWGGARLGADAGPPKRTRVARRRKGQP